MSTSNELKEYLIGEKNNGFLLTDDNNEKTIMLSGAWGAGKTHFWKQEIEPELSKQLKEKNKACVYVSLYGKTSIESIELDIYMKSYQHMVGGDDFVSKTCSVFTNLGKNLGNIAHKGVGGAFLWLENLVDKDKFQQAGQYLEKGGIICFDDFERKSKDISLNDLFGFISQLALEYKCKIVIILNSEVFVVEEANVFKTVKEKTVNKFFYFEPTIKELFSSIYDSNEKYKLLDKYKEEILITIEETEELNARIYIQVLDNCLEWITNEYSEKALKALILTNINFILNNFILDYKEITRSGSSMFIKYKIEKNYLSMIKNMRIAIWGYAIKEEYKSKCKEMDNSYYINQIKNKLTEADRGTKLQVYSDTTQENILKWIEENKKELIGLWKYGYRLYYMDTIDKETYELITNFIKSGILNRESIIHTSSHP